MKDTKKEVRDFLNSLSREELIELLKEAGFEVENGDGKVIFTDTDYKPKPKSTIDI